MERERAKGLKWSWLRRAALLVGVVGLVFYSITSGYRLGGSSALGELLADTGFPPNNHGVTGLGGGGSIAFVHLVGVASERPTVREPSHFVYPLVVPGEQNRWVTIDIDSSHGGRRTDFPLGVIGLSYSGTTTYQGPRRLLETASLTFTIHVEPYGVDPRRPPPNLTVDVDGQQLPVVIVPDEAFLSYVLAMSDVTDAAVLTPAFVGQLGTTVAALPLSVTMTNTRFDYAPVVITIVVVACMVLTYFEWQWYRRNTRINRHGCPECGYSRTGLAVGTPCPECGAPPQSSR